MPDFKVRKSVLVRRLSQTPKMDLGQDFDSSFWCSRQLERKNCDIYDCQDVYSLAALSLRKTRDSLKKSTLENFIEKRSKRSASTMNQRSAPKQFSFKLCYLNKRALETGTP